MKLNITKFFQVQQAIKVHHWITADYSLHVLLDDFLKDYNELVDEIVENFLSEDSNEIEVNTFQPSDAAFESLGKLIKLAKESFNEICQNIDKMPKGMRTIVDEVTQTMTKYRYLFGKFA